MNKSDSSNKNIVYIVIAFVILMLVVYFFQVSENNVLDIFENEKRIKEWINQLGLLGPIVIVLLISMAVVISPIPSAPIALISGAVFGHTLGTLYVVVGAIIGAMLAFMIARKLGYDYVSKKMSYYLPIKLVGSQSTLMMIVFLSRLAPFISFDIISYAAGLTPLTFLRFIMASVVGILPVSFLLAHLGSEALNGEIQGIAFALLFLGTLTIISLLVHYLKRKKHEQN